MPNLPTVVTWFLGTSGRIRGRGQVVGVVSVGHAGCQPQAGCGRSNASWCATCRVWATPTLSGTPQYRILATVNKIGIYSATHIREWKIGWHGRRDKAIGERTVCWHESERGKHRNHVVPCAGVARWDLDRGGRGHAGDGRMGHRGLGTICVGSSRVGRAAITPVIVSWQRAGDRDAFRGTHTALGVGRRQGQCSRGGRRGFSAGLVIV